MTVLDKICADKRLHLDLKMRQFPLPTFEQALLNQPPPRGFIKNLKATAEKTTALITEVKKASPSKGLIRATFDAAETAQTYEENGAACLCCVKTL